MRDQQPSGQRTDPVPNASPAAAAHSGAGADRSAPINQPHGGFYSVPYPMMVAQHMPGYAPFSPPPPAQTFADNNALLRSLAESKKMMDEGGVPDDYQQMVISVSATAAVAAANSAAAILPMATLPQLLAPRPGAGTSIRPDCQGDDGPVTVPESVSDLEAMFRRYRGIVNSANDRLAQGGTAAGPKQE